ncbi:flavin-containing superfamily amine oxidase [Glonium stellatum]|uniref:Flavin-containing superfamily amine oxidase n=1 Tax=Glonium stellatum TaxID=574774 RepID=A0A8E2ENC5_9PEZI|nr:flavin-containing superfamily amine oxidase [Glonium stellatum]
MAAIDFRHCFLSFFALFLFTITPAVGNVNEAEFSESDIITRDVCIIGGGSSGTYSAIRLQQMGKSVAVVEKESVLGGHVNTYFDPVTGESFDYGVISFDNITVVRNYFDHFGIKLAPLVYNAGPQQYADFANATFVSASALPQGNLTAALIGYGKQLEKYPYLFTKGYDLPSPVPADLLLSYGDFINKYNLQALAYTAFTFIQGVGNLLAQPTLYIMKYFAPATLNNILTGSGFLTTANHDNHELYEKALAELGSSAFISSNVTQISRNNDSVRVVISTTEGRKLIRASQLLIAIQPKLSSLSGFLDLDAEEASLLGQFNNSYYWDSVVRNSGVPDNTSINNVDPAAPFALPPLPGIYSIGSTGLPGLHTVYYGSPYAISNEEVKSDILTTIAELVKAAGYPPVNGTAEFVGFNDHRPFELTVSVDAIKAGFYARLNGLQGRRKTWWTGATWQAHDSSQIWNWTEYQLLPKMAA